MCEILLFGTLIISLSKKYPFLSGVFVKKKLESKELGKYGLMFYNCLFMLIPGALFALYNGEFSKVRISFLRSDLQILVAGFAQCMMPMQRQGIWGKLQHSCS